MTHEIKNIFSDACANQAKGLKNVLATVVFLEGSSYRKPGVQMLISEDGKMTGAVSGGCVEKEIKHRAESVFKTGESKIMTYDGRYRLGCEGILYILIEPFIISEQLYLKFQKALDLRESFKLTSNYVRKNNATGHFGSQINFSDHSTYQFNDHFNVENTSSLDVFSQNLDPLFRLIIIGGEHDAVKLCIMASVLGWDVEVITSIKDPGRYFRFSGRKKKFLRKRLRLLILI
ncbi:XdhC family protein [Halpernia sp. GG3]